jgi:hypothetical protein
VPGEHLLAEHRIRTLACTGRRETVRNKVNS